jgi:hypothetical protein
MACGGRCSITFGEVRDFDAAVSIQSITRIQLDPHTGLEIPGRSKNIQPWNLRKAIRDQFKRRLKRFVAASEDCEPGCFCVSNGKVLSRRTETFPDNKMILIENVTRATVLVPHPLGADTAALDALKDDVIGGRVTPTDYATGKPCVIDPVADLVEFLGGQCCVANVLDFSVENRFKYVIQFKLTLEMITEAGECRSS